MPIYNALFIIDFKSLILRQSVNINNIKYEKAKINIAVINPSICPYEIKNLKYINFTSIEHATIQIIGFKIQLLKFIVKDVLFKTLCISRKLIIIKLTNHPIIKAFIP